MTTNSRIHSMSFRHCVCVVLLVIGVFVKKADLIESRLEKSETQFKIFCTENDASKRPIYLKRIANKGCKSPSNSIIFNDCKVASMDEKCFESIKCSQKPHQIEYVLDKSEKKYEGTYYCANSDTKSQGIIFTHVPKSMTTTRVPIKSIVRPTTQIPTNQYYHARNSTKTSLMDEDKKRAVQLKHQKLQTAAAKDSISTIKSIDKGSFSFSFDLIIVIVCLLAMSLLINLAFCMRCLLVKKYINLNVKNSQRNIGFYKWCLCIGFGKSDATHADMAVNLSVNDSSEPTIHRIRNLYQNHASDIAFETLTNQRSTAAKYAQIRTSQKFGSRQSDFPNKSDVYDYFHESQPKLVVPNGNVAGAATASGFPRSNQITMPPAVIAYDDSSAHHSACTSSCSGGGIRPSYLTQQSLISYLHPSSQQQHSNSNDRSQQQPGMATPMGQPNDMEMMQRSITLNPESIHKLNLAHSSHPNQFGSTFIINSGGQPVANIAQNDANMNSQLNIGSVQYDEVPENATLLNQRVMPHDLTNVQNVNMTAYPPPPNHMMSNASGSDQIILLVKQNGNSSQSALHLAAASAQHPMNMMNGSHSHTEATESASTSRKSPSTGRESVQHEKSSIIASSNGQSAISSTAQPPPKQNSLMHLTATNTLPETQHLDDWSMSDQSSSNAPQVQSNQHVRNAMTRNVLDKADALLKQAHSMMANNDTASEMLQESALPQTH